MAYHFHRELLKFSKYQIEMDPAFVGGKLVDTSVTIGEMDYGDGLPFINAGDTNDASACIKDKTIDAFVYDFYCNGWSNSDVDVYGTNDSSYACMDKGTGTQSDPWIDPFYAIERLRSFSYKAPNPVYYRLNIGGPVEYDEYTYRCADSSYYEREFSSCYSSSFCKECDRLTKVFNFDHYGTPVFALSDRIIIPLLEYTGSAISIDGGIFGTINLNVTNKQRVVDESCKKLLPVFINRVLVYPLYCNNMSLSLVQEGTTYSYYVHITGTYGTTTINLSNDDTDNSISGGMILSGKFKKLSCKVTSFNIDMDTCFVEDLSLNYNSTGVYNMSFTINDSNVLGGEVNGVNILGCFGPRSPIGCHYSTINNVQFTLDCLIKEGISAGCSIYCDHTYRSYAVGSYFSRFCSCSFTSNVDDVSELVCVWSDYSKNFYSTLYFYKSGVVDTYERPLLIPYCSYFNGCESTEKCTVVDTASSDLEERTSAFCSSMDVYNPLSNVSQTLLWNEDIIRLADELSVFYKNEDKQATDNIKDITDLLNLLGCDAGVGGYVSKLSDEYINIRKKIVGAQDAKEAMRWKEYNRSYMWPKLGRIINRLKTLANDSDKEEAIEIIKAAFEKAGTKESDGVVMAVYEYLFSICEVGSVLKSIAVHCYDYVDKLPDSEKTRPDYKEAQEEAELQIDSCEEEIDEFKGFNIKDPIGKRLYSCAEKLINNYTARLNSLYSTVKNITNKKQADSILIAVTELKDNLIIVDALRAFDEPEEEE